MALIKQLKDVQQPNLENNSFKHFIDKDRDVVETSLANKTYMEFHRHALLHF